MAEPRRDSVAPGGGASALPLPPRGSISAIVRTA